MAQDGNGKGKGWHGDPEGHAAAGRKGGVKVSQNRAHMAAIGRKGGQVSGGNFANNPQRAREAGRKGGEASGGNLTNTRERVIDTGLRSDSGLRGGEVSGIDRSDRLEQGERRSFEGGTDHSGGEQL